MVPKFGNVNGNAEKTKVQLYNAISLDISKVLLRLNQSFQKSIFNE
jgi:hypothetical protein